MLPTPLAFATMPRYAPAPEKEGGSSKHPESGEWLDNIKPLIHDIDFLSDADRKMIYEDNAKRVSNL